ncbi:MAG: protoporphyrinogen oxidase HemJ [Pseudomonadota bacterium]
MDADAYLWLKTLHIIFMVAWMAGLFYLPRLFVYHCEVTPGTDEDARFQVMEKKLLRYIMNPAMILTWVFGFAVAGGVDAFTQAWFHAKLLLVVILTIFHMVLARWRRLFAEGRNSHSARFYRYMNEVPTVLFVVITILVVVKPF